MGASLHWSGMPVDLSRPVDLSWPVRRQAGPLAFGLPPARFEIFATEGFVGDVAAGGSCNVEVLHLVPHGNGTHTECWGHVSEEAVYISDLDIPWMFPAVVAKVEGRCDQPLGVDALSERARRWVEHPEVKGVILHVRNVPPPPHDFTGTRPPFVGEALAAYLAEHVEHLITNLPSVDAETSKELPAHRRFLGRSPRSRTITELACIPEALAEGPVWLVLMVPAIETDAVPSRPVAYPILQPSGQ